MLDNGLGKTEILKDAQDWLVHTGLMKQYTTVLFKFLCVPKFFEPTILISQLSISNE